MQAIILAAGNGTRLGYLTKEIPKCMVKVNEITMIERMLRILDKKKLVRIVIVVGFESETLITFINTLGIETKIVFVKNEVYNTTNNIYSLFMAKEHLLEHDTLLLESDLVFEESMIDRILESDDLNTALVAKYEPWMDGTVVRIDENRDILSFISKGEFDYDKTDEYYKTVNIYKFSKAFSQSHYVPFLIAYCSALGKNEYYEQVLKVLAHLDNPLLKALPIENETWYEVDDAGDLDIAEVLFETNKSLKFKKIMSKYGGYWRYPGLIDFCYLVNPYYPNKKMIDEITYSFNRLMRDYPSGLGVNTLLSAKYFNLLPEHIVVGNGASELIKSLMSILTGKLGVIIPTFEEYRNRVSEDQCVIYDASTTDYHYDSSDLINFYKDKGISNLLLINPDNPSGNYLTHTDVLNLCEWTQSQGITLVLDESFIDFMSIEEDGSLLEQSILNKYPNLVVVKSISKSHGVPGFRLGVLATSNEDLMSAIKRDVSIWNINSFGEYYMQIAGKYKKDFTKGLERFVEVRSEYELALREIEGIRVLHSEANYIMFELIDGTKSLDLCETILFDHNILIKDLTPKDGFTGQYIRVAVKLPHENDALVQAIKQVLGHGA